MNYEVSQKKGGPEESLRVGLRELAEGHYEVRLGDRVIQVDAVKSGRTIYSIIEDGRQFEALVDEKGAHGFDVLVRGRLFHLEAVDERTRLLAGSAKAVASGPQTVEAEMPGKVVQVKKRAGDAVAEGEGVVILEAMKMQNEIPSPIEGVVTHVAVSEGDTVEGGAPLFTVEPPEGVE
jgi:acetyl/propionyl-CoA carboxylase alpha subunit